MTLLNGILTFGIPTDDNRIDVDLALVPETDVSDSLYSTILSDRNSTNHSYLDVFTVIVNDDVDSTEIHKIVNLHLSQDITVYHSDLIACLELDKDEPLVYINIDYFVSNFAYLAKIFALFDGDPDDVEYNDSTTNINSAISELDAVKDMAAMMTSEQCESRLMSCFA